MLASKIIFHERSCITLADIVLSDSRFANILKPFLMVAEIFKK